MSATVSKPLIVFVDTNILLDVLAIRSPFFQDASRVWTHAETGRLHAHVSIISFTNCWYVLRRLKDRAAADRALTHLRDVFRPVDLTAQILDQAIHSHSADFEDAVQFHSAMHVGAIGIITRDPKHFPGSPIPVLSPAAFMTAHGPE